MAALFRKAGVDTVVFDIQDVGVRFYTYIWMMYHAMVAARETGAFFVVLDRPNPIGRRADGPLLKPEFASGAGLKPIIQQHGMTVGELAGYFNVELLPHEGAGGQVELEVVRVRGWSPRTTAQQTGLLWVPPSPNIPTPETATAYAGTGYFEGTNLSEGRGTTLPFNSSARLSWTTATATGSTPCGCRECASVRATLCPPSASTRGRPA